MTMKPWAAVVLAPLAAAACSDAPPGRTYFERNIQPILTQACAGNTSGCHRTNTDDPFDFAAGNFDVTSFEKVQKRRDLLQPFGAFSHSLLLIKAVPPGSLSVAYGTGFKSIEVLHAGGPIFEVGSPAYLTLQQWVDNGATENGLAPPSPARDGGGQCSTSVPPGFVPATYTANANFAEFRSQVQPILRSCAGSACHGAPQSDFYITCGDDDTQLAFNFAQAWAFVNEPVDDSQILRVPLAVKAGGLPHSGGDQLASRSDAKYLAIRAWADKVKRVDFGVGNPGKQFFAQSVQPLLLQRGCSFEACHSPSATNDFKLRTGTTMLAVPYKGTSAALTDLMAGAVDLLFVGSASAMSHVQAGSVKAIGVTSKAPIAQLPNVPPLSATVPGFESSAWFGLMGPSKMDPRLTETLYQAIKACLSHPDMVAKLDAEAAIRVSYTPAEFSQFIRDEMTRLRDLVTRANIKFES